jgi:hypothetical protein
VVDEEYVAVAGPGVPGDRDDEVFVSFFERNGDLLYPHEALVKASQSLKDDETYAVRTGPGNLMVFWFDEPSSPPGAGGAGGGEPRSLWVQRFNCYLQ